MVEILVFRVNKVIFKPPSWCTPLIPIVFVGTYANETGQTSCLLCPSGESNKGTGNKKCSACSIGYYDNNSSCIPCPEGMSQSFFHPILSDSNKR